MRVLSVVTLVTPTGAYGGPVRVAANQARALRERGHDVTVMAGSTGFGRTPPGDLDGVPVQLFGAHRLVPRTGFAGLAAPAMLRRLAQTVRRYDVVHVHLARDLVTLPAALLALAAGVPVVLQCHGMIDDSTARLARLADPLLTGRALSGAARILYLTPAERDALAGLLGNEATLQHLPNGVPAVDLVADPATPEVLYLARLAARKRPALFVHVADQLQHEFPDHRWRLVGPDEGEGPAVRAAIARTTADVVWEGPLAPAATSARMSRAGVLVLPSVDEPYPMAVLEAMSVGLPVIVTDSCGLAPLVAAAGAGLVTDEQPASLAAAVRQLLADPDRAAAMGATARQTARTDLGMESVAAQLEEVYRSCRAR